MSFTRINGVLHAEQCSLQQLAQQFGTPLYVYSKAAFLTPIQELKNELSSLDYLICFATKSNSNLHVAEAVTVPGLGGGGSSSLSMGSVGSSGDSDGDWVFLKQAFP